jgi:hypothetical protein
MSERDVSARDELDDVRGDVDVDEPARPDDVATVDVEPFAFDVELELDFAVDKLAGFVVELAGFVVELAEFAVDERVELVVDELAALAVDELAALAVDELAEFGADELAGFAVELTGFVVDKLGEFAVDKLASRSSRSGPSSRAASASFAIGATFHGTRREAIARRIGARRDESPSWSCAHTISRGAMRTSSSATAANGSSVAASSPVVASRYASAQTSEDFEPGTSATT